MTDSLQRRLRIVALEALYEAETSDHDALAAFARRLSELGDGDPEVASPRMERFGRRIVEGVMARPAEVDELIAEAAPRYPVETLGVIDRVILRLAVWELLSDNSAPVAAVINEAVELAHRYGGESSPAFVNGVLGTISKRIRAGAEAIAPPPANQQGATTQE